MKRTGADVMELQQFGTIETGEELANAMLCIDVDRPAEAMLHWWGEKTPPAAILVQLRRMENGTVELAPQLIYRGNAGGGLWLQQLSAEAMQHAKGFSATLHQMKKSLEGEWVHATGKKGRITFRSPTSSDGVSPEECANWSEFKEWAGRSREKHDAVAFRGHGSSEYRLKTTLHRAYRHRLERYCAETLLQFRGHAEAVMGMRFDMDNGDDYSMLLGLAQHHGLPTPLLDWTGSPYIAAFFAFADAIESAETRSDSSHVRIYGLTRDFMDKSYTPVVTVPFIKPYVSPLSISARNNPRLYAQQGQFLVTNVADVERYICSMEQGADTTFLIAADVPIECASEALEDLAFMGLSAATMFPGLDGVCRMIKHAMSFKRNSMLTAGKPSNSKTEMDNGFESE